MRDFLEDCYYHFRRNFVEYIFLFVGLFFCAFVIYANMLERAEFMQWCENQKGTGYANGGHRICVIDGKTVVTDGRKE